MRTRAIIKHWNCVAESSDFHGRNVSFGDFRLLALARPCAWPRPFRTIPGRARIARIPGAEGRPVPPRMVPATGMKCL